jgi:hypothetical protein
MIVPTTFEMIFITMAMIILGAMFLLLISYLAIDIYTKAKMASCHHLWHPMDNRKRMYSCVYCGKTSSIEEIRRETQNNP